MKTRCISKLGIVLLTMCLLLDGCNLRYYPPSPEETKAYLARHREDIEAIVDYLKELEYDSVFIKKADGKIFFEFEWHDISSKAINSSICRLWKTGCVCIYKDNEHGNNTISFEIWNKTMGDVDCGIACTIDGQGTPKTCFQVSHEVIEDGWYYYYDDYEEYRSHRSKYHEHQPRGVE